MEETQLLAFLKKARTMSGVAFKVEFIEKDASGNAKYLSGFIIEQRNSEEIFTPMRWNVLGVAINALPFQYDLIELQYIDYSGGNQAHVIDNQDSPNPQN